METYIRYYTDETPYSRAGYAMFVDLAGEESVDTGYGPARYEMAIEPTDNHVVDAWGDDFVALVDEMIKDRQDEIENQGFDIAELRAELAGWINPGKIVESAGAWDCEDIVCMIWEHVMEPHGWSVVRTNNGAIAYESETQAIEKAA